MAEATGEPDLLAPSLPGGEPLEKLLRKAQFFSSGKPSPDRHEVPPRWAGGQGALARAMATGTRSSGPRIRGLFIGQTDVTALTTTPLLYQLHASAAWRIWDVWPFTRLVPAWSYPLWFLWRPYIVYNRVGIPPNEPGTGGRRWRRIGTPY